ncbi:unnamed protein product [Camellia sinensis]
MDNHTLWGHLPLLVRANSKESVEYILQSLWRTRKVGLDSADRDIIREMLQLDNESDLDPLLVCLRMLIRRCVYENINKDEIQKLFPSEVLPELQRLLTLLLQKFQREWREDIQKDQVSLPRLKAMTWNMANPDTELTDPVAVINLKLQNDTQSNAGEMDVKFQLAKDTLETMLRSMYCIRDQLSDNGMRLSSRNEKTRGFIHLVCSCYIADGTSFHTAVKFRWILFLLVDFFVEAKVGSTQK